MKATQKPEQRPSVPDPSSGSFTAEERAAMRERAQELKAESRRSRGEAKAEEERNGVLEKIAEMPPPDRDLAEHVHAVVSQNAPGLTPKLWYGMPGYAKDGKMVLFFQGAAKFASRYATLGFTDEAALDDGEIWPTAFALTGWSPATKNTIVDLVKRAAG